MGEVAHLENQVQKELSSLLQQAVATPPHHSYHVSAGWESLPSWATSHVQARPDEATVEARYQYIPTYSAIQSDYCRLRTSRSGSRHHGSLRCGLRECEVRASTSSSNHATGMFRLWLFSFGECLTVEIATPYVFKSGSIYCIATKLRR